MQAAGTASENKWDRSHPKALKTRVSNVLKPDTVTKSSVTSKLDKVQLDWSWCSYKWTPLESNKCSWKKSIN
ncbi:hypothetical protein evm_006805 [Chilo suppressalis]|nr:hypothetical protein evm_006805 [Chilo suppressalis]